jgi:polyisoprenoid-binding protein YceI
VSASIDAASLETFSDERDAHLRSEDFFDVERYPRSSSSPEKASSSTAGRGCSRSPAS